MFFSFFVVTCVLFVVTEKTLSMVRSVDKRGSPHESGYGYSLLWGGVCEREKKGGGGGGL